MAEHDGLVIVPINNYDKEDGKKVRKIIEKVVAREGSKYKQRLPVNWLCFQLTLRKRKESVISLAECKTLAKEYHISEDELPYVLACLHKRMGVIRYYDDNEALKNTVITDPAVLFKAITQLIVATFKSDTLPNSVSADTFKNYGLFKKEDVRTKNLQWRRE